VKNLEALMVHVLSSESLDIVNHEFEVGLICLARVAQVVLGDFFGTVSQECADGLDARGTLKVLRAKQFVQMFLWRIGS